MNRKPKDKREKRLARKQKKRELKKRHASLRLADNSYVDAMMEPDSLKWLVSREMLMDPRINIWLIQLAQQLEIITQGSPVTLAQAKVILEVVNEWENKNAGKLKSKLEATVSVARLLDEIIAMFPCPDKTNPQLVQEHAQTISEIVNAIQIGKANFVDSSGRVMQPEGQAAVASYLYCMKQLLQGANGIVQTLKPGKLGGAELARRLWANARDARVFEIPEAIWQSMHRLYEQQFFTEVAQQQIPEAEALNFLRLHAQGQSFPEKLPFDYCYIGLGAGIMLDLKLAKLRFRGTEAEELLVGVNLLGYLICGPEQEVYEMLHVITMTTDFFMPLVQRYDGRWPYGETLAAWLVPYLVDLINEHNTVVLNHEPTSKMRDAFRRTGKGAPGFLPKPYYTVRMKHKVIDESEGDRTSDTGFGRILSYRYDRRGHERCYIERGPLPIDEKTEKKLLKYGYRFILGKPNAEDSARLAYRQVEPKRSDEWVAIKVRWIDTVVVGDAKLPYVPAVRVPEKRVEA